MIDRSVADFTQHLLGRRDRPHVGIVDWLGFHPALDRLARSAGTGS